MAGMSFDELLRRRLGEIQDQGSNSTASLKERVDAANYEKTTNQEIEAQRLQKVGEAQANTWQPPTSGTGTQPNSFEAFMNAISGQESGGSYSARNRSSGAMGRYQIMPANIAGSGGWDMQALGRNVSVNQFMNSPDIQNSIARYMLKQYYDRYGAAGAAVAWYAGEGNAKKYVASGGKGYNKKNGNYPSVSNYVASILKRMGY